MKILILKPGTLREIICATPAINAVREHYPDAQITLLTTSVGREIYPEGSMIDICIEYERYQKSKFGWIQLLSTLRRRKFDIIINLHTESKSLTLLAVLSGAKITVGSNSNFFGKFYTTSAPPSVDSTVNSEYFPSMEIVEKIGVRSAHPTPVLYRSDRDKRMARDYFDKQGLYKKTTLVLAPTTGSPLAAWSPENFAAIGRKFVVKYGGKVLITWSDRELGTAQEVQKLIGDRAIICPKTTLGEFAALLAESGVFLCHHSSAMHIAYSAQVPTVYLNSPIGNAPSTKIQIGIPGIRFHYQAHLAEPIERDEDRAAQLATIRTERVWEAVEKIWNINYY